MKKENQNNGNSLIVQLWRLFRSRKTAVAALIVIVILMLASFLSAYIAPHDPNLQGDLLNDRHLAPGSEHWFGTDKFGRDLFSRVLFGGRISLTIAFAVVLLSATVGLVYGLVSGFIGGRTDAVMMRILDFLLAFPMIFLLIMIIAVFNVSHWYLIPILGLTGWMETARLVRAETLSVKERPFILAARGFGFSNLRIIFRHIAPFCVKIIFVTAPLKVAEVILLESALSFLGIGVQPPTPSWGNIINDGRQVLLHAWWVSTIPGIFITITVLSFHLLGEGLKKGMNPLE